MMRAPLPFTLAALLCMTVLAGCFEEVDDPLKTSCDGSATALAPEVDVIPEITLPPVPENPTTRVAGLMQQGPEDPIRIGTLLPITGSLSAFGGSMENAAKLAVKQINAAGGVGDHDVELLTGDSKSSPAEAPNGFMSLSNQDVHGVVGAASSGVTGSILDLAIDNSIFVVSPASTSPALTLERDNEGWFARVPPSYALQGKVLAQLVYDAGCMDVTILAVNNAYGVGLGAIFEDTFEGLGGDVLETVKFEEQGTTYASQVQQAAQGKPDAIIFIGYPAEGTQVVREAFQKGIMSQSVFFFSEGVKDPAFVEDVGQDADGNFILADLQGTTPESVESSALSAFKAAYMAEYGDEPGLFAAETYDAVMAMALAAAYAGEHSGSAIKDNIRTIYNKPGTDVSAADVQAALDAAHAGTDINYVGVSNDFDWDANGDPASGVYSTWKVTAAGEIETTESGITP